MHRGANESALRRPEILEGREEQCQHCGTWIKWVWIIEKQIQVVSPMFGVVASARIATISAAVWPCAAQCILFCTVLKNRWDASMRGS